jgi:steroid delta-isomerase-like uncharacterized protein
MKNESRIAANTKLVREFVGRVFNKQDASAVPEFMAADVEWHGGTFGTVKGSNGMTAMFGGFFAALPDLHATELAIVATDDTVWVRFAVEGTSKGSLFGFPATGKKVRWEETDVYRVADGKIVEEWSSADVTSILHQVGAYTPPWIS